jgi:hypothetical protein
MTSTYFSYNQICCDIPGCDNLATEMFEENVDESYTFPVCLCKECKEKW